MSEPRKNAPKTRGQVAACGGERGHEKGNAFGRRSNTIGSEGHRRRPRAPSPHSRPAGR